MSKQHSPFAISARNYLNGVLLLLTMRQQDLVYHRGLLVCVSCYSLALVFKTFLEVLRSLATNANRAFSQHTQAIFLLNFYDSVT